MEIDQKLQEDSISTTRSELSTTHAGSAAGVFWIFHPPYSNGHLLYNLSDGFSSSPDGNDQWHYVLYIFTGLIPFLGFSAALIGGTSSLTANKELLLNTVFPAELVPFRAVLIGMVPTVAGLLIVSFLAMFLGHLNIMMLGIPLIIMLLIMFVSGLVWVLSLMNMVMRDIQFILTFVTMALLIVSPIAYTESMVPESLKLVIYFNPYPIISWLYTMLSCLEESSKAILIGVTGFGFLSFSLGFFVSKKLKRCFWIMSVNCHIYS